MQRSLQRAHAIASHKASEIGRPTSSPNAKLRFGHAALEIRESVRFMVAALLTIGNDLPFPDKNDQTYRMRTPARRRAASHSRVFRTIPVAFVRSSTSDVDLILSAISFDPARRQRAAQIILLGGGCSEHAPKRSARLAIRLAALALAFSSRAAFAQEPETVTPMTLLDPYQADGIRLGSGFVLRPEVNAQVRHDTNIYNIDTPKRGDTVFDLQPRLTLSTDLPRHQVELYGAADLRRYAKYSGENSEAGELGARGLLELGSQIDVRPSFAFVRGIEQRGTSGDQFLTDRPVVFNRKEYRLDISRGQQKLELALGGRIRQTDYEDAAIDGVLIDLSSRNVVSRSANLRVAYNLGSRIQAYSRFEVGSLSYRNAVSRQLNSSGYDVLAGGRIRVTNQIDLEVGAGIIHRKFDNPAYANLNAANFALTASWVPRQTWQVIASAGRSVDPSPRLDTPAIFRTSYRLEVKHLVTPKLLTEVYAGHVREEYRGFSRTDKRFEIGASALYRLTRNIGVTVDVGYRDQDGGALGRTYSGFAAGLGVRVVG